MYKILLIYLRSKNKYMNTDLSQLIEESIRSANERLNSRIVELDRKMEADMYWLSMESGLRLYYIHRG